MPLYDDDNHVLSPYKFTGAGQVVAMNGAAQASAAVTSKYVVVLSTAVYCQINVGASPTATTSHMAIPPNKWVPLYVGIGNKVSGLAASGSLIINELV